MEGKLILLVIALLIQIIDAYPRPNHILRRLRRHHDNTCHSPSLTMAMQMLQADINSIKHNLRCRMDPGTCSESMLRINDVEQTYSGLGDVCNESFLNDFRMILREFYMNMTRIRGHITALQSDLILFYDDPILPLANALGNDIKNALQESQPNVAVTLPSSCTYTYDGSGESDMLMDLIHTINNFDNFVTRATHILRN